MWMLQIALCFMVRHLPIRACISRPTVWNVTVSGMRYVDDDIGHGVPASRVGVRYNLSYFDTDQLVETTGNRPLLVHINDTDWRDMLHGMQMGGRRRVLLSPADVRNKEVRAGTTLKLDLEMVPSGAWPLVPTRRGVFVVLYVLSFLPYTLPDHERPVSFRTSRVEHVKESS